MSQRRTPSQKAADQAKPKPKKLRLVKVRTQAVFAVDDGDTLQEVEAQVVEVPASAWPSYPDGNFKRALADLERQLNEPPQA